MKTEDYILAGLGIAGFGGIAYALTKKPPRPPVPPAPGYPKTISRAPYSFTVNNAQEETQLKDFLGIHPPGADIDTYLSGLTTTQLNNWKTYWTGIWSNLGRGDIVSFIHQMYGKYTAPPGYPKTISRGAYSFVVNNIQEESQAKDMLGIDPPGVDIDTYLSGLTLTQLGQWKDYWVKVWTGLHRTDIFAFVGQMYGKYAQEVPPAPPGTYPLTIITTDKQTGAVVPNVYWSLAVYVHAIYGYEFVAKGQTNSSGRSVVNIPSSPSGTADGRYKIQFSTTTYVGLGSPYIQFSMPASPYTLQVALEPKEPTPPSEQTITIHVQNWDTGLPVKGAMVNVDGETQFTSGSGDALFRLMTGRYQATIEKGGYETDTQSINVLHRDKIYTIDLRGEGAPPITDGGYLEVTVLDVGGNPIEGIPVVFAQSITAYNKTFYTNSSGKAKSGELMGGEYAQFRVNSGSYFGFVDSGWTQVSILPNMTTPRTIKLPAK